MKVFQARPGSCEFTWSFLGSSSGACIGYMWYDAGRKHVYELAGNNLEGFASEHIFSGPLLEFTAGGKKRENPRPKAKCTARVTRVAEVASEENVARASPRNVDFQFSRSCLPVDATKCRARVWNSGVGYGAQCLAVPMLGSDFCKTHTGPDNLPRLRHGRYDNPVDPVVKAMFDKEHAKKKRRTDERWYSRIFMWYQVRSNARVQSVEDLTDREFDDALQAGHIYLSKNKGLREEHGLKPNEGPMSSASRRDPSSEYVGSPMLYKYFSQTLFCKELHALREGATPATATEREFEKALAQTNSVCHNLFVARNMSNSYHYRGPQCWSHRLFSNKTKVEPADAPQRPLLSEERTAGIFGGLICNLCEKTRRVGSSTFDVFHNDAWLSESMG